MLVQRLRDRAAEVGCTSARRDLAWLLARPERVVPLPGTRRRRHLDDNLAALSVRLTPGQFEAVGECIPEAFGARAPGHVPPGAVGTSAPPPRPLPPRWLRRRGHRKSQSIHGEPPRTQGGGFSTRGAAPHRARPPRRPRFRQRGVRETR
ncbi:aldo/keto reductase [Streptomyces virginiae]|uniref:aldo/keto reductase n=1 Tax=Streptomyces virginiae TaxID=1961 RepID=UPI0036CC3CBD